MQRGTAKDPGKRAMALTYALQSGYPTLAKAAKELIRAAFADEDGNVTRTAQRLGVTRSTMTKLVQRVQ